MYLLESRSHLSREKGSDRDWIFSLRRISLISRDLLSLGILGSELDWIYSVGRRSSLKRAGRIRQKLPLLSMEKISCLQGLKSQIGTRCICKRVDHIFRGKKGCTIETRSFRYGEYLLNLGPVEIDRDQIFSQGMMSLLCRAGRVSQGLDHYAREEIFSLYGDQGHTRIRSLHQGKDLDIFSFGILSFLPRAGRVRQELAFFTREDSSSLQGYQGQIETQT